MKDAYSFHADATDFKIEYDKMAEAYTRIFERVGLQTQMVAADNGYIGGEYCHEFQVEHPEGEGRYFVSEDGSYAAHEDVAQFQLEQVNPDEEIRDFEIIDQPAWVKTMDDNIKHYGKDKRFFLKNVVYKTAQGDIIIVTIRGDLDVNQTKLEQVVSLVGQLENADETDLAAIGTKTGYVHSWGHSFIEPRKAKTEDRECKVIYVADNSLKTVKNFIGGQKEDTSDSINVNYGRDFKHEIETDVAMAQAGFTTTNGLGSLQEKRGIEVGNIFQLGYHYSEKMQNATFVDAEGSNRPYYMGCYGIGLGRTLATIIEKYHDDRGIIWPKSVAPYQVHLVSLKGGEEQAQNVYTQLLENGIEVLWDDREESAGTKFADADLIGLPVRLVVSKKTQDNVEYKERTSSESELLSFEALLEKLRA